MVHDLSEAGWSSQGPVVELSDHASWELLASTSFGHLGLDDHGRPDIFPVDYYCDGRTILFRTASGTKLYELTENTQVAFEVDADTHDNVWSVVVRGTASVLNTEPTLSERALSTFPTWVPVEPFVYVSITAESIRGRLFQHRLPIGRCS